MKASTLHGKGKTTCSGSQNALTTADYWDKQWTNAIQSPNFSEKHPYLGRNGILINTIQERVGPLKGLSVLELGGGGANVRLLALCKWGGANVSAIDYSSRGLDKLRTFFNAHHAEVGGLFGDFTSFDFQERRFDLVVHWGVIEHFKDPQPVILACRRALKPDGKLLFSRPNPNAWMTGLWRQWSPNSWAKHIWHSEEDIRTCCEENGMSCSGPFYFGYLAFKPGKWERKGLITSILSFAELASTQLMKVFPAIVKGTKRMSKEQGFFAQIVQT